MRPDERAGQRRTRRAVVREFFAVSVFSLQANCGAIKTYSFSMSTLFYMGKKLKMAIVDILHFINLAPVK